MSTVGGPRLSTISKFTNTYSLDFDGIDDYVDTNSTKFSGASEFSISMWANFSSLSGNNPIVSNWFTGVTNYIVRYSSTKLQFYISTTGGVAKVTEYTFTPTLGIWYSIICVYNGSNISIYINGTQQGTPTAITGTVLANTNNCLIGERGTEHFSGIIDEVSYFDRVLTPTEITDISTTPTDLTSLTPIAWYRMGDNGAYKSPQWLIPNNENKDKVSNYSLDFDGVDDYVEIPNITPRFGTQNPATPDSATNAPWSVSIWAYIPSGLTTTTPLFNIPLGNSVYSWKVIWGAGQIIQFGARYRTLRVDEVTTAINTNQWNHIVVTFDGVDTNALTSWKLFINGVNITNLTSSGHLGTNVTGKTYIAKDQSNYGEVKIDELSLYDIKLTDSNVTDIYNGGTPTTISGAIAHWIMGEEATFSGGVWTVPDAVGSNNGTSNAMTIEDRVGEAPNSENNALSYNMDEVDRVEDTP